MELERTVAVVFLSASLGAATMFSAQAETTSPESRYTVTLTFSEPLAAHIRGDINVSSGKLSMYPFGDDALADGWATYVHNLVARDDAGRVIEARKSGRAEWEVPSTVPLVHLDYVVDLSPAATLWPLGNLRYAKFDGASLFLTNRVLFIDSGGPGERLVDFNVPQDWQVSSPLKQVGPRRFAAHDNRDLVLNTTVLGHYTELEVDDSGFRMLLVLQRGVDDAAALIRGPLKKVVRSYLRLFRGNPSETYLMTVFQGASDDGESYNRSAAFTTTDPIRQDNMVLWCNFIAHELFHHWNGQQITGKEVADRRWFNEGFTEYFANKTLVENNLISDDLFVRKMEHHLGNYSYFMVAPAFQGTSILDSGKRKGFNRFGVYDGGWAVAFCLDMRIRTATSGARTIDDFMRAMYERFGLTGRGYTLQDIASVATEIAHADEREFFANYVEGHETLPIGECSNAAGLEGYGKNYAGEMYIFSVEHPTRQQLSIRNGLLHEAP